jgi:hypothetical protein
MRLLIFTVSDSSREVPMPVFSLTREAGSDHDALECSNLGQDPLTCHFEDLQLPALVNMLQLPWFPTCKFHEGMCRCF